MVSVDVNRQVLSDQVDRCGHVFWFTGLSGAGKTTLARAADEAMKRQGLRTCVLDGDVLRQGLNRDLGFDEAARSENIRRAAEVARLMADAGLVVLAAFISPYRRDREMARQIIGPQRFVEVFVDTPLSVCEQRDPKGLYRKARAGQLPDMTGIGSPYEAPLNPEMRVTPVDTVADVVHLCLLQCGNNGDA